jgi:hypothetical protein
VWTHRTWRALLADVDEAPSQRRDERADQGLRITHRIFKERRGQTQQRVRVTADLGSRWGGGRGVAARLARELADVRPALQAEAGAAAGRGGDNTHYHLSDHDCKAAVCPVLTACKGRFSRSGLWTWVGDRVELSGTGWNTTRTFPLPIACFASWRPLGAVGLGLA